MQPDKVFIPAILIPVYNHEAAIPVTLERVLKSGLPVLLVDDGSDEPCQKVLQHLAKQQPERVFLHRLSVNGGKGAAVKAGLRWLQQAGYSHGLQLDADGQHDINDIETFIACAKASPEALVSGYPQYDDSVPKLRLYSRYLTHIWVWINTLSFAIKDSMCGFRVYPLMRVVPLLESCGNRMDFDPEIIVRWFWRYPDIINIPTRVLYPIDGVSHFLLWKDNSLITLMHTRLFFGMLCRLPRLLWRKRHG
jgi:glycosyltransferase involved in cell wall biosynthesis